MDCGFDLGFGIVPLLARGQSSASKHRTSTAANKALVPRYYEAMCSDDVAEDATVIALLRPDFLDHDAYPAFPPGREGARWFFAAMRATVAGWQMIPEDLIAEGDKVVARVLVRGTHQGPLMGLAPTGRAVAFSGIEFVRITDGQLVERWATFDRLRRSGLRASHRARTAQRTAAPPVLAAART